MRGSQKRLMCAAKSFSAWARSGLVTKKVPIWLAILIRCGKFMVFFVWFGVKQDDSRTWEVDENAACLISDASDNRLSIDVPLGEKNDAKGLGARWDANMRCWWIATDEYHPLAAQNLGPHLLFHRHRAERRGARRQGDAGRVWPPRCNPCEASYRTPPAHRAKDEHR